MSVAMHRKVIAIIGWREWLRMWPHYLRVSDAWAWCERVIYCHHNARVIADFEHRMACVLCECTRGMSKPYYTVDSMVAEIHDFIEHERDEAYAEGRRDGEGRA